MCLLTRKRWSVSNNGMRMLWMSRARNSADSPHWRTQNLTGAKSIRDPCPLPCPLNPPHCRALSLPQASHQRGSVVQRKKSPLDRTRSSGQSERTGGNHEKQTKTDAPSSLEVANRTADYFLGIFYDRFDAPRRDGVANLTERRAESSLFIYCHSVTSEALS